MSEQKTYIVEFRTTGREVWSVDAASEEEARNNWAAGQLVASEVIDSEFYDIQEER